MNEVRLPLSGAGIIIEPCSATKREAIRSIIDQFGLPDRLMPEPTTPLAALGPAMIENYPAPTNKVRHTLFPYENSSKGKKVGCHDPKEHLTPDERFCETVALATLRMRTEELKEGQKKPDMTWTGEIKLDPYDYEKERAIMTHMRHVMDYVPAGKLRALVEGIVEHLGGSRPFEGVPLLWITPEVIPLFKPIKTAIEAASAETDHHGKAIEPTRIHVLSIVADEEATRALIGMLVRKVEEEAARVEARLAQPALSVDQAGNDICKAMGVKEELERYEELLKQPLTDLKTKTDSLVLSINYKMLEKSAFGGPVSTS